MPTPELSVIIPTYNAATHIGRCLTGLQNQTFEDFEIVIVDDNSSDATRDIIEEFEELDITLIHRTDETGITSAINTGIANAKSDLIARHDADDWSHPDRFKKQVQYMKANPEVALLGTGANIVDSDGKKIETRDVMEEPSENDLIEHNHYVHGSVIMRKEALKEVGFYDERFKTTEDYDLWLRLAKLYPIRNINEPLYNFRKHDGSIYAKKLEEVKLYGILAILRAENPDDSLVEKINQTGYEYIYEFLSTSKKVKFHKEMAKESIRYGELSQGRSHAVKLLKKDPKSIMGYLLIILSFMGKKGSNIVITKYRKHIWNRKI